MLKNALQALKENARQNFTLHMTGGLKNRCQSGGSQDGKSRARFSFDFDFDGFLSAVVSCS